MSDGNLSLKESIAKAGADQQEESVNESNKSEKTDSSEGSESNNSDSETENDETIVEESSDPEIEEAVNFYKALKDPAQQKSIIAELASRAGLLKPGETISPTQQKTFNDLIGEILGEEYPDLKDKMTKLFDAYDAHHNEELNKVKTQLVQEKIQQQVETFESEFTNFIKENKVTEAVAAKMLKEIEDLPPTVGKEGRRIPLTTYLGKIHRLATGSTSNVVEDAVKRNEKIERNLKERSRNLPSDVDESRLKKGSSLPSVRESIAAAAKGITFDE